MARQLRRMRSRPRMLLVAFAAAAAVGIAVDLAWPRHSHASILEFRETFTRYPASIKVPPNATRLAFVVRGASGENGGLVYDPKTNSTVEPGGAGGNGGEISGAVVVGPHTVRPGDVLRIIPGRSGSGQGTDALLRGGEGGADIDKESGARGGDGGGGSGVFVERSGQWLFVAGGGGGGGGASNLSAGRPGGSAGHPGTSSNTALGGSLGGWCPEIGAHTTALRGGPGGRSREGSNGGAGGGGGGGCYGGAGGESSRLLEGGAGGAGGRSWNFAGARDVRTGLAPMGDGSVEVIIDVYSEPPPMIISPDRFDLEVGRAATANVESQGKPPPHYSVSGEFPAGVRFSYDFSGIGRIRGTPEPGSEGTYTLHVKAENEWGSATQVLHLVVHPKSA